MNLLIFNALSWEQRKLLDCIQKITDFRGRTPKKLGMDWSEEGYLALSALNVKDGYIDFNQDIHYGNQELYDKWMTGNELHKGQVLFTTEAPMGNVAQVPDNRRYILSQRVIALDVKDNLLTENFLATVLRTPTVFAYLTALSSGGTAKGVSQKSLSSVEIRLPKNLKEQEKIADTFSNLDHIITLHQSKAESWKNKKNQLSTISWEQRKLGDLMDVGSVKRVHQSDWRDSGVRFLRARDVVADFNNEEPDDYLYIDQKMYEEYSAQSGKVQQGDLLVTGVGTIGIPMLIKSEKPLYFKDGNIIWFKNKNAIDGQFFYYSFISKGIQDFIKESAGIGTVGTYTIDSGKKTPINLPTSIEEQKKIGAFLESIDNVITLHHRKLNRTQICINRSFLYGSF